MKEELKELLSEEEYEVIVNKGTEKPGSGKLLKEKRSGFYHCRVCGEKLFTSKHKFDSGCGWPSFFDGENIEKSMDLSHGMMRIEITCSKCGAHLGHLFDDGPLPTGLRYCVNSVSLDFKPN